MIALVLHGIILHALFNLLDNRKHSNLLVKILLILLTTPIVSCYVSHASLARSYVTCYTTLALSIIAYRLSPLHPLARHPGPTLAKISKLWGAYHTLGGQYHKRLSALHRRHGSIVRIGPNELSIIDPSIFQPIFTGMGKGPMWDGRRFNMNGPGPLIGIRSQQGHAERRKRWSLAFGMKSIKQYEAPLLVRVGDFCNKLKEYAENGEPVDMVKYLSFFSYDFTGDIAFNGRFDLVNNGDVQGVWSLMEKSLVANSIRQHIPWCLPLFLLFGNRTNAFRDLTVKTSVERFRHGPRGIEKDVSHYLLDEDKLKSKIPTPEYVNDAALVIIAGSDTISSVLSACVYALLTNPQYLPRLKQELDGVLLRKIAEWPSNWATVLAGLPLLNAIINEALRLYPGVPSSLQRAPYEGSGGFVAGSLFVPEGTAVTIPPYVIHRQASQFGPNAGEFHPERWMDSTLREQVNQAAFIPFAAGPANCVGKPLAMMEMRCVVAMLVQEFDMEFTRGCERNWAEGLKDYLVWTKEKLLVDLSVSK